MRDFQVRYYHGTPSGQQYHRDQCEPYCQSCLDLADHVECRHQWLTWPMPTPHRCWHGLGHEGLHECCCGAVADA